MYSADAAVQREALVLIDLILRSRPPGDELSKRFAVVVGGLMKAHPRWWCIQEKACRSYLSTCMLGILFILPLCFFNLRALIKE